MTRAPMGQSGSRPPSLPPEVLPLLRMPSSGSRMESEALVKLMFAANGSKAG